MQNESNSNQTAETHQLFIKNCFWHEENRLTHTKIRGCVNSVAPTLLFESEKASEERFDTIKLLHKDAESGVKMPKFYIACGKQDFLYEKDQAFAEEAKALGCDVTTDYVDGYGHEWRFWDVELPEFLDWLPRTDIYSKMDIHKM